MVLKRKTADRKLNSQAESRARRGAQLPLPRPPKSQPVAGSQGTALFLRSPYLTPLLVFLVCTPFTNDDGDKGSSPNLFFFAPAFT